MNVERPSPYDERQGRELCLMVKAAARRMSREQILDLADALHAIIRRRRELRAHGEG